MHKKKGERERERNLRMIACPIERISKYVSKYVCLSIGDQLL